MENNLVVKANKLNESRYKLTVVEQRIILAMISLIKPSDSDFKPYSFTIKQFESLTDVSGGNTYSRLKKITSTLRDKGFTIKEESGDLQLGWVSSVKYYNKEGRLELTFDPHLKPYLIALKKEFTRYQLKNTIKLRSTYSVRIYELLKQYQSIGSREFELYELRSLLGLGDNKLQPYANFRRKVIDVAHSELKNNSDIYFEYQAKKTGRKVTSILFIILENPEVIKKSRKSPKKRPSIVETQKDLFESHQLRNQSLSIENERFDEFAVRYPDLYKKLNRQARATLTKREKKKAGVNLTVKFKMKGMLSEFLKSEGIMDI